MGQVFPPGINLRDSAGQWRNFPGKINIPSLLVKSNLLQLDSDGPKTASGDCILQIQRLGAMARLGNKEAAQILAVIATEATAHLRIAE
jgi:hypothetical protein